MNHFRSLLFYLHLFLLSSLTVAQTNDTLACIKENGQPPVDFIKSVLDNQDLIIFDDALHAAQEPFDFYRQLLSETDIQKRVKYVFIEILAITVQPYIDAYLQSEVKDSTLLIKAFQDDFSGYGWRYQTYVELLAEIWRINKLLPAGEKINVICIDQPVYWQSIHTRQDYDLFQKSLAGRDYYMYLKVIEGMDSFNSGRKGFLLTNTRHAYKHIRKNDGHLAWNCGTFFNQWHPGKTYSVRIHNINFELRPSEEREQRSTSEGLEKYKIRWVRTAGGTWDRAFSENGNLPVALPLKNNIFGRTPYSGNLILVAEAGQTMYDAYDGLIFLAPLEELHFSARIEFIYTPEFKKELARRIRLLEEDHLAELLNQNGADTIQDYVDQISRYQERRKNPLIPE